MRNAPLETYRVAGVRFDGSRHLTNECAICEKAAEKCLADFQSRLSNSPLRTNGTCELSQVRLGKLTGGMQKDRKAGQKTALDSSCKFVSWLPLLPAFLIRKLGRDQP